MKKISEHLGEIIVALACIALLISAITVFSAPVSDFFSSIVSKETAMGNEIMTGIGNIDVSNIGVDGNGGSGGAGGDGGSGGEVGGDENTEPDEDEGASPFYTYTITGTGSGYVLGLTDDFKTALNNNSDYVVEGETLWTAGTTLPQPLTTYEELPVNGTMSMFKSCTGITSLDLSNWNLSNVKNASQMFYNCPNLTTIDISGWDLSTLSTSSSSDLNKVFEMFKACSSLETVYVSSEADKTKLETYASVPGGCTVIVK